MRNEPIVVGSGLLYISEYAGTIPADADFEKEENLLGYISGGASIELKEEFKRFTDDLNQVTKDALVSDDANFKTGVLTWNGNTLSRTISTARVTTANGIRTVKLGGIGNYNGKKYAFRFVHNDIETGKKRLTIVGRNQSGLNLAFAVDKETVVDVEIKGEALDSDGTKIIYTEEIQSLVGLTVTAVAATAGKTKVSAISPSADGSNTYKAKIGATAETVIYDTAYTTGWTNLVVGTTEFAATSGQVLTVIEVDGSNKAKKAGTVTVTNQIG